MSQYGWQNIEKGLFVNLFAVRLRSSPQTVSDDAVCLRKFYLLLHNMLIINTDKFLQRGGILGLFWRQMPQNTAVENLQERLSSRSFCVLCDTIDI